MIWIEIDYYVKMAKKMLRNKPVIMQNLLEMCISSREVEFPVSRKFEGTEG